MAAEVSYNNAWYTLGGGLGRKAVNAKSYTPFGEQLGEAMSGYGYNGEYYNAATGMIYLRARFYAPEMNRFSQKDTLRGSVTQPGSLNRYLYCQNDPVNFVDPSGMRQVTGIYGDGTGRTAAQPKKTTPIITKPGVNKPSTAATTFRTAPVQMTDTGTGSYTSSNNAAKQVGNAVTNKAHTGYAGNAAETYGTSHNSGSFTESPSVSGVGNGRGFSCGRNIHALGAGDYGYSINSQNESFLSRSIEAFLFGSYSNEKQTWLSIVGSIATGFLDVDLPLDIRDFAYDVTHTNELEHPRFRICVDVIAFIPVIGALKPVKYVDDAADIIKQADNAADIMDGAGDVAKHADGVTDAVRHVDTALSERQIRHFLNEAINNPGSNKVILGQTGMYDIIGKEEGFTYFKMSDSLWDELVETTGRNYDEVWKVNERFLDEQLSLESEILLSNDPKKTYLFSDGSERFFQREINYLMNKGYSFVELPDGMWQAILRK